MSTEAEVKKLDAARYLIQIYQPHHLIISIIKIRNPAKFCL